MALGADSSSACDASATNQRTPGAWPDVGTKHARCRERARLMLLLLLLRARDLNNHQHSLRLNSDRCVYRGNRKSDQHVCFINLKMHPRDYSDLTGLCFRCRLSARVVLSHQDPFFGSDAAPASFSTSPLT